MLMISFITIAGKTPTLSVAEIIGIVIAIVACLIVGTLQVYHNGEQCMRGFFGHITANVLENNYRINAS